jgi:predicted peptidase
MKKKLLVALLTMTMLGTLVTGCGSSSGSDTASTTDSTVSTATSDTQETEKTEETQAVAEDKEVQPTYKTITEGMDWGPAITKVVLEVGENVDESSFDKDTFTVSSERKYKSYDFTTSDYVDEDSVAEREVVDAYVSDDEGNPDSKGTCITIEMAVGPTKSEGSPYSYDMLTSKNGLVETGYLISASAPLKTTAGGELTIIDTVFEGNSGNINVIADDFDLTGKYTDDDTKLTLTYASYVPDTAKEGETPLIIWLHGAGEGGTDPSIALLGNKVVNLETDKIQKYFGDTGAEILAPQTPTMWLDDGTGEYLDTTGSNYKSYYTETLMGLIEQYVSEHPEIDTNRIYIGGCSNGGYMTVNMIIEYPDYFAAAYPVCEAYAVKWLNDDKIEAIKDIPIWLTAAKTDGVVQIYKGSLEDDYKTFDFELDDNGEKIPLDDYSNALYNRLVDAGASNVHFSLFENVVDTTGNYFGEDGTTPYEYNGHWSWIYTLNNECEEEIDGVNTTIFEWLAAQSK